MIPNGNAKDIINNEEKFGHLDLDYKFKNAKEFFKKFNGKIFEVDFECNQELHAYLCQAEKGKMDESKMPPLGYFDLVGKKRMEKWKALGEMPSNEAKQQFVSKLDKNCPYLAPYLLAHSSAMLNQRRESEIEILETKQQTTSAASISSLEPSKNLQEDEIRKALNAQTQEKFRLYAQTNFPDDKDKQEKLIEQLQERHFHQYMMFICQMQLDKTQEMSETAAKESLVANTAPTQSISMEDGLKTQHLLEASVGQSEGMDLVSTWQRKDHKEFIDQLNDDPESKINVSNGEIVKIRVSANTNDTHIMWEFACLHYDISFGISLEPENTKEEIEILSIQRYNCHQEVICGSHRITNKTGTYILKFDNSYSLWRSKDICYKVYFSSPSSSSEAVGDKSDSAPSLA